MSMAELVAERSTCLRRRVGAVAIRDKRILATGYNGAPSGLAHCSDLGCLRERLGIPSGQRHELCRGLHAEQNVIIQAASFGISLQGAELYLTDTPCLICAKMLINSRIRRIICSGCYPDQLARELLDEAGMAVEIQGRQSLGVNTAINYPFSIHNDLTQDFLLLTVQTGER